MPPADRAPDVPAPGARRRAIAWTLGAAAAATLALFSLALVGGGWPGEPNGCRERMRPACFCEAPRPGLVAQPANTGSNLGFVAVGVAIAGTVGRRRRRAPANPMTRGAFHPTLFAVVVALLGPGSMALHASLTRWGGHVDVTSMYLFSALLIAYGVTRVRALRRAGFLALYLALVAALVATKLWLPVNSDFVFGASLAAAGGVDVWTRRCRPALRRDARWLAAAGLLFGGAFAIWLPSRSGGALCDPESLVQGHAVWHLLCALAAGCLYLYLASESDEGDAAASESGPGGAASTRTSSS